MEKHAKELAIYFFILFICIYIITLLLLHYALLHIVIILTCFNKKRIKNFKKQKRN